MPLYTELPESVKEVDVIIAGGGTSGCVVAARLARSDPDLSILLIEEGPNNDLPSVNYPVLFMANLDPSTGTAKFYKGNKAAELDDREPIVPTASVLGGGSSMNMMTYSRGQRSDFDAWKAEGWSADEILPYMKKLETYHGPGSSSTHGSDGPIHISKSTFESTRVMEDFIAAAARLGYPEVADVNDLDTNYAVQRNLRYISPDGKRQDAVSCYLRPVLEDGKHPNLHIVVNMQVLQVLVDGKRADGVTIKTNVAAGTDQPAITVKARKMVILSAGAFGTPQLLEKSGVGSPAILEKAGISLVVSIPGVGQGYQDHQLLVYPYQSSLLPEETLDGLAAGRIDPGELILKNDPMLGWNGQEVIARIRPSEEEVMSLGADFRHVWASTYAPFADRPLAHLAILPVFAEDPKLVPVGQYFSMSVFTVYPESRGHVHITGPDPTSPLDFTPGFFSDQDQVDIKKHVWAYKKQREIVRRMSAYRGEVAVSHPQFGAKSAARCIGIDRPLESVQDLVYSSEDDEMIEKWLREHVGSTWHSLGTCKMAPVEDLGVVDARLGVHGIEGLKIADLSIVPANTASNTNNLALVIGEKAADIFINELYL